MHNNGSWNRRPGCNVTGGGGGGIRQMRRWRAGGGGGEKERNRFPNTSETFCRLPGKAGLMDGYG